jgi:hypothetical protein
MDIPIRKPIPLNMVLKQKAPQNLEKHAKEIQKIGKYDRVRILPDGSIAGISNLIFTRAIFLSLSLYGYERRFCFEDKEKAEVEFENLQSEEDVPTGWVARRP